MFFLDKPLCATDDSHHREHHPDGQPEVHIQDHHWQPGYHPNYLDKDTSATGSLQPHSRVDGQSLAATQRVWAHSQSRSYWSSTAQASPETARTSAWGWWRWCTPALPENEKKVGVCFGRLFALQCNVLRTEWADLRQEVEERPNQQQDNQNDQAGEQARELQTQTKVQCNNPGVFWPFWEAGRSLLCPTCVWPPALSSMFVVARVAELGKQVKKEDTVLETPWANSSWGKKTAFLRGILHKRESEVKWTHYLVGVDGVAMLVSVDHRQWDGHGVADEGDGHRVAGDVGEGAQGRQPWPGEPGRCWG